MRTKSSANVAPVLVIRRAAADTRPTSELEFETAVVSFFIDAAEVLGVPKSVAAIYGICFASAAPLTFADIYDRLNLSQGSISQGLKVLREVGALRVSGQVFASPLRPLPPVLSSRPRERYEPDLEIRKLVRHYLESRVSAQLKNSYGALQRIAKQVPANNGSAKILKARVRQLQSWHDRTVSLLPLVKSFLKLA